MTGMGTGPDGPARPATEQIQEQVEQRRRELADTARALHDKADVKGRARERAVDAELAVAKVAHRVGRKAEAGPRFVRWTVDTASGQAQRLPKPVREPVGRAAGVLRSRVRVLLGLLALAVAVLARRRRSRRCG